MAVRNEVFVLDNGACTAKVGVSNAEHPRYVQYIFIHASQSIQEAGKSVKQYICRK
jgi:actin-related protein